jgi:hypothetical protein
MKNRVKCPACDRVFQNDGKGRFATGRLHANLANHMKGAHGLDWKTGKKIKPIEIDPPATRTDGGAEAVPTRRAYTRKPKPFMDVGFCPRCGCNINAVRVAMGL